MKITIIAGARPNFMKIAPIIKAIHKHNTTHTSKIIDYRLIHTGQHYDAKLSDSFFEDLGIPQPNANLEVGSASHAVQTANIMIRFEQELINNPTDLVLVVGDVNSTMACTLVAKKMNTKVAHVEAGLRSFDMEMPEEINRLVTDIIADYFFTTSEEAGLNLGTFGTDPNKIFFVGNTMMDSLILNLNKLIKPDFFESNQLQSKKYLLLTLHRPSNVDDIDKLLDMLNFISENANNKKIIFPVHPRTLSKINELKDIPKNIIFVEPVRYLEFIYLIKNSFAVVTDSGGIQEETTYLGIPCFTLRENTERPETVRLGTNLILGFDKDKIKEAFRTLNNGNWKKGSIPPFWDGNTADRIIEIIAFQLFN